jgi:hypothetical protein
MVVRVRLRPGWVVRWASAAEVVAKSRHAAALYLRTRHVGAFTLGLALFATTTADIPAALLRPALSSKVDARIARLERFFHFYGCPRPYHVAEYLRAADTYQLDYRLLPSISIRETQCGIAQWENNWWGYHPHQQTFPSVEVGIDYVSKQLAENPYYKGKMLHDKLFTYNPRTPYPDEVKRIMRQIE